MKTILVVGASGNIGSFLMCYLKQKGYPILGVARHSSSADILSLDMSTIKENEISQLLKEKKVETIIHCVAALKPAIPSDILLGSLVSSKLLLNEVGRTKKHIIFGSVAEYGLQKTTALKETSPLIPDTDYCVSKILQSSSAFYFFDRYNIRGTVLRLSNVISPTPSQKSLINKILMQAKDGDSKDISINDLAIERDFIDIRDIAAIVERFLALSSFDTVYNVSSGINTTYRHLIDTCNSILKKMGKAPLRIQEGERTERFNTAITSNKKILTLLSGYQFHTLANSLEWCMNEVLNTT